MLLEFMTFITNTLFTIFGGYPLTHHMWPLLVWITLLVTPVTYAMFLWSETGKRRHGTLAVVAATCCTMLVLFPPLMQHQMLSECEKEETEVVINGEFKTMVVTYCRHKENINGEFGEWKPSQQVEYK